MSQHSILKLKGIFVYLNLNLFTIFPKGDSLLFSDTHLLLLCFPSLFSELISCLSLLPFAKLFNISFDAVCSNSLLFISCPLSSILLAEILKMSLSDRTFFVVFCFFIVHTVDILFPFVFLCRYVWIILTGIWILFVLNLFFFVRIVCKIFPCPGQNIWSVTGIPSAMSVAYHFTQSRNFLNWLLKSSEKQSIINSHLWLDNTDDHAWSSALNNLFLSNFLLIEKRVNLLKLGKLVEFSLLSLEKWQFSQFWPYFFTRPSLKSGLPT